MHRADFFAAFAIVETYHCPRCGEPTQAAAERCPLCGKHLGQKPIRFFGGKDVPVEEASDFVNGLFRDEFRAGSDR